MGRGETVNLLERRQEKLTTIDRQVKRLVQLLDDVVTITRAESTGFQLKPTSLDLVSLSAEIIEELQMGYGQGAIYTTFLTLPRIQLIGWLWARPAPALVRSVASNHPVMLFSALHHLFAEAASS